MRLFAAALALLMVFAPLTASAQGKSCRCRVLPLEGVYDLSIGRGVQLKISYLNGSKNACPTKIKAALHPLPRERSAITSATLECQSNGMFSGKDDVAFLGAKARWELEAYDQPVDTPESASQTATLGSGIAASTEFAVLIRPPETIRSLPMAQSYDRTASATLSSSGKAPGCVCEQVAETIKEQRDLRALYSSPAVQKEALENGRVSNPNFGCYGAELNASYEAAGNGVVTAKPSCFATGSQTGFDRFVSARTNSENSNSGGKVLAVGASTDPTTCEISVGTVYQCDAQVVLQAIIEHETVHQKQCMRIKADDALSKNAERLRGTLKKHPAYKNRSLDFLNSSYLYFNSPVNRGRFEKEAYDTSIAILDNFYGEYCD